MATNRQKVIGISLALAYFAAIFLSVGFLEEWSGHPQQWPAVMFAAEIYAASVAVVLLVVAAARFVSRRGKRTA